ncbi:hypothetical protein LCGC14_0401050 [marine sediment metagenome]|uniref:Phage tail tape measure protein domain-containing protein n=1 Tax=marine sediment metagenome TaxID=412755 RepID=A0A0F9TEY9_9ZZZZ
MAIGSPDVNITIKATDKASGVLKRIGGGFAKLGLAVAAAGAAAAAGFAAIGFASVKAAISLESAFAGVAKTTDGLVDDMGRLTQVGSEIRTGFRDLAKEVPIAVEELLKIGELAGQLGIPKNALIDFTETVAALGETTNLTTEAAATSLARLGNIYQVKSENMAESTSQVGSALVALGNQFATNEADIISFAERIAGAGKIAGLTQSDILAIGAAFSSVGIQAESGGTAVQTVLQEMQKAVIEGSDTLDLFAEATGKSAEEFADAFRTDAAGAFSEFVLELGNQGEQAFITLEELGLADRRLSRAFLSLGGAGDLLNRTMEVSNEAFDENIALMDEARIRYLTTESQLRILKNVFRDIGMTIGNAFLPFLNMAIQAARPFIDKFVIGIERAIDDFLTPALEGLVEFFSTKLPAALEGLAAFFEPVKIGLGELVDTFLDSAPEIKDAWEDLKDFFKTTIAPGLQDSFDNIGEGLIGLAELWEENDSLIIKSAEKAFEFLLVVITIILNAITGAFKGAILLIQGDWDGFWQHTKDSAETALNLMLGIVDTNLEEFKATWKRVFEGIVALVATQIALILREIDRLAAKFRSIVLPSWMRPGSPTPLEVGLRGIAGAMNELASIQAPQLAGALSGGGAVGLGGSSVSSSFVIQQLTVHAGQGQDGTQIAQQIMDEIGRRVRVATASGQGFVGT